jgi:PAS domain S-box-containing protein
VIVAHEDVTERHEAEQRYQDIFERAAEGIYRTDLEGRIVVANPALARMLGYESPEALYAADAHTQSHYADTDQRVQLLAAAERRPVRDFEIPMRRTDGTIFWWSLNVRAVRDTKGELTGFEGTASEVTERRRAEERARRQNRHLRLLQTAAVAANEAASPEEAMQSVLDEVCRQLDWPVGHAYMRDDALGPLTSSEIWHDNDPATFGSFREVSRHAEIGAGVGLTGRVLATGVPDWATEIDEDAMFTRTHDAVAAGLRSGFAFPVRVGREVVAVMEFFSLRRTPRDEELLRVLAHIGNQLGRVVERSRGEQALRDAYEREKEATKRLLALDEMKNSILTAVSHELRTPLTAVYGFAELLETQGSRMTPEETSMVTGRLAENARKLERLLADLLEVDRLTRGIVEPRLEVMDLSLLVHRVVKESGSFEGGRVELHAEPVTIPADRAKVERIVENLVGNALRYSPEDSKVDVTVGPAEGGATIVVEDRGPGVPEELRTVIFEPFRQGPNAVRHSPGVGIGLSLVQQFAALHGGGAHVEERPGGGARFVVFLPLLSGTAPTAGTSDRVDQTV